MLSVTAARLSEKEPLVRGVEEVLHLIFVMVHFMGQLDWAMGRPDIWSNIIWGISVRVFSEGLTFKSIDWVKQITFPNVRGLPPISGRPELNKKSDPPPRKGDFLLPDCPQTRTSAFSDLLT